MGLDNKELLRKTDLVLADLEAGGKLSPEQSNKFIDLVIDTPTVFREARVEKLKADKRVLDKMGFSSRILRRATDGAPLAEEQRSKPGFGKVEIQTHELIAEVRMSYSTFEDNIEGAGFEDRVMSKIADRVALDLEELVIQGDTTNESDTYLATFDGVLKLVDGHTVDAQNKPIERALWRDLFKSVPKKYMRNRAEWRYYTSHDVETDWRDYLADRATGAGDRYLLEDVPAVAYGIPVVGCAMMPDVEKTVDTNTINVTSALLTHPQNIIVGFHRDVSIETDKDISARQYIIVVTCRVGLALEEKDAAAKLVNIKVA